MVTTIDTMGARAVVFAFLAAMASAGVGCSDGDNHYEIAPPYDAGAGRGHKDDGPSPYLQTCDIKRRNCGGGGAVCQEITFTDAEHTTEQSTSVCTAPCTSNDDCSRAPTGANKVACVPFASRGFCLMLCSDVEGCPSGFACKGGLCVNPTR